MAKSLETQVDDYLYFEKLKDVTYSNRLLELKFINPDDIIDELGWEHDQYHFDAVMNGIKKCMYYIQHSDDIRFDTYLSPHTRKVFFHKGTTSQQMICDYYNTGICELPTLFKKGDRFYPGDLSYSISWDDPISVWREWRKEEVDAKFTVVSDPYWALTDIPDIGKYSHMFVDCVSDKTNKTYRFCTMHDLDKSVLDSDYHNDIDSMISYYPEDMYCHDDNDTYLERFDW